MLNRRPIVAVVTLASSNVKTGDMAQLWIMPDEGEPPHVAIKSGADASVCGDCRHRGDGEGRERSCYVTLFQGPRSVWVTWWNGGYPEWSGEPIPKGLRFGAWGDPAALPADVLRRLRKASDGHTGYTHQWRKRTIQTIVGAMMASVDTVAEKREAQRKGYRTFRVVRPGESLQRDEIWCPATPEGGSRTTCDRCRLCQGADVRAKSIAVVAHGSGARYV
jgi:hypothetical protein